MSIFSETHREQLMDFISKSLGYNMITTDAMRKKLPALSDEELMKLVSVANHLMFSRNKDAMVDLIINDEFYKIDLLSQHYHEIADYVVEVKDFYELVDSLVSSGHMSKGCTEFPDLSKHLAIAKICDGGRLYRSAGYVDNVKMVDFVQDHIDRFEDMIPVFAEHNLEAYVILRQKLFGEAPSLHAGLL